MAIKSRFARNVGIVVISVPMLLYGASSFDNTAEGQPVVQVGDRSVDRAAFDRQIELSIESQAEIYGNDTVQSEEFRNFLANQLMTSFAQDLLLQERVDELGMHPVDDEVLELIHSDERFQVDGEYSPEVFQAEIANKRYYLRELRARLGRRKLDQAFSGAEIVTEQITDGLVSYLNERRIARMLEFPLEFAADQEPVSEDDLQAYYDENIEGFVTPNRVRYEYIEVTPDLFEAEVTVDEEALKEAQEQRAVRAEASEERQLGLIALDSAADAESARGQLDSGGDFEELARELSTDAGSSDAGGDIGLLARADIGEAFSSQVFDAAVGDVVGPFESDGQWLIFKVKGLIGGHVEDFEEAREQLVAEVKKERIEALVSDKATELEDATFEAFDRLDTVAEDLGLELETTDWLSEETVVSSFPAPFNELEVINEVFLSEFVEGGLNSDLLHHSDGHYLVARTIEYDQSRQQTLAEVRDEIRDTLRKQEALIAQFEKLTKQIEAQRSGEIVPELPFAEQAAVTVSLGDELSEDLTERQRVLVFSVEDSEDAGMPAYALDYDRELEKVYLIRLEEILPGETGEDDVQEAINAQANFSSGLLLLGYIGELESIYGVKLYAYDAAPDSS